MTDRRVKSRRAVILPALCWNRDRFEFYAITIDISADGIRMRSASMPSIASQLECSIRGVGTMKIRVVRVRADDFIVRIVGRGLTSGEVVRNLVKLARLQAASIEAVRGCSPAVHST